MRLLLATLCLHLGILSLGTSQTNALPEKPRQALAKGLSRAEIEEIKKWQKPALEFPITGMTPEELAKFIQEIGPKLPADGKIVGMEFTGPARVIVTSGERRTASWGCLYVTTFERRDGLWSVARRGAEIY